MRVLVVGAGVIGVTSAYLLHRAGMQVTLLEAEPQAAAGASHANGGQLSYSHAEPWANPDTLKHLPRWLLRRHSPLAVDWRFDPELWWWLGKFLVSSVQSRRNALSLLGLAAYSREVLRQIVAETGIRFDYQPCGTVHLCRDEAEIRHAARQAEWQSGQGECRFEHWNARETRQRLPALMPGSPLAGSVFFPDDATGNAAAYTEELAQYISNSGVNIEYNKKIISIQTSAGRVSHLLDADGRVWKADAFLLCSGVQAGKMLGSLRRYVSLQPMQGYSLTIPFAALPFTLPHALTDSRWKMVYSPLGDHLRMAGMGTVGAWGRDAPPRSIAMLREAAAGWFGESLLQAEGSIWAGLRPATPNGLPFLGKVPEWSNLYVNAGHGTLGWTLAAGSAGLLRDQMLGRPAAVPADAFAIGAS